MYVYQDTHKICIRTVFSKGKKNLKPFSFRFHIPLSLFLSLYIYISSSYLIHFTLEEACGRNTLHPDQISLQELMHDKSQVLSLFFVLSLGSLRFKITCVVSLLVVMNYNISDIYFICIAILEFSRENENGIELSSWCKSVMQSIKIRIWFSSVYRNFPSFYRNPKFAETERDHSFLTFPFYFFPSLLSANYLILLTQT